MPGDLDTDIEVWECNLESWEAFHRMSTQWNVGMGGATGLNYSSIPVLLDLLGIDEGNKKQVFLDIQIMEQEALATMAERQND